MWLHWNRMYMGIAGIDLFDQRIVRCVVKLDSDVH